jgi:hypothetical protein
VRPTFGGLGQLSSDTEAEKCQRREATFLMETRDKVDRVAEEQGLGSRSEALLFLVALRLMALPYLLDPTRVKEAARKVERGAKISQRKGRVKR